MVQVKRQQARPDVPRLLALIEQASRRVTGKPHYRDIGTVQQVGNGVALVSGLAGVQIDEVVQFENGVLGLVFEFGPRQVQVVLLGREGGIQGGDMVTRTGRQLKVPVGSPLLGRIVNPLGEPLDGQGRVEGEVTWPLEWEAPDVVARAPVDRPLLTGWKLVDALLPIGRGQRELILGDRQTGKTTLAIDAIANQAGRGVKSVYVAIGQKKSTVLRIIDTLRRAGALAETIVVLASPDDPPALRYLAPYAGCTMAERLMATGFDTLIVYDDLTRHADAYRELSLLLRRPPGREAYPGDIFYLHSRLLERAAQLHPDEGGRSMTALPIAQTQRGNIAAYIPTNLISITDGQIILDADLFNQGFKPAVEVGLSVSRVGGAAQRPAMRLVASRLKLELAQYEEVAHFARFGAEVDEVTRRQIERGERLQALLIQPEHRSLGLPEQVIILYAATHGLADGMKPADLGGWEQALLAYCQEQGGGLLAAIAADGSLPAERIDALDKLLAGFRSAVSSAAGGDHQG